MRETSEIDERDREIIVTRGIQRARSEKLMTYKAYVNINLKLESESSKEETINDHMRAST